jgi:hypothetical protein
MMNTLRRFVCLIAMVGLFAFAISSEGSPRCCEAEKSPPLVQQFEEAQIVLLGHFENAKPASTGLDQGTTDFVIERVYKDHDMIKGKKVLSLPRYITDSKTKFIVFCDIYKGKIDAYKGTPLVDKSEMVRYIDGIMKIKGKSQAERLRYAFDFLNSPEVEVSTDAYREFARADYNDYKDVAKKLPAETLAGWLKDPKTPSYRYGLYSMLLGHCGNPDHARLLLEMINDPERRKSSGLHGLMMAYTLIEPEKGWTLIKNLVHDKQQPFLVRYAGLQTVRFLYECRTDVINKDETIAKKDIVSGVLGVLNVTDMADFAIEDLRKWKRWECADQVIGLFGQKNYTAPIIRKSILRYALQCPTDAAKAFVKEQRVRDKEWVDDTQELLDLETVPATVTPTTK